MTSDSKDSPKRSKKKREASQSPESSKKLKPDNDKKRFSSRHSKEEKGTKSKAFVDLDKPQERYPRYYGEDSEKRKNSDRYWNKYARDDNQVGSRYYGDKPRERRNDFEEPAPKPRERKQIDDLTSRTGGAYIPPAKLRLMQAEITDKSSTAYQRIAWEALKKSIHGFINKVNISNIAIIAKELLHENIVRGRGLLSKSIIQAQAASPTFSNVYAALVSIINSKFPNIGELLLNRLVLQFKRGFKQNNKTLCISSATFIAHLVNQGVAHEILSLEILTLLVESPTDDSVEVAISFLKECGQKLTEVSSKGINAIFEMLRNILHEGQLEKRIQYMIEVMFQIRKDGFKDHAAVVEDLDLVEEEDQFTHLITLDDVKQTSSHDILNVFKFDDKYEENEGKYKTLSKEILDFSDSESGSGSEESDVGSEEEEEGAEGEEDKDKTMIIDKTDTNLITLRRTIYLTMQSSLDYEECTHKLLKMELKPGQEIELCHMILDCCAEQRTYEKFFGLVAQRFCQINKIYIQPFQQIFKDTYATTHRLDANRLRNVSKFFAHLLFTDAIGWDVLETMKLNEEDTNSSSRIFIKILCQELAEYMGLGKLNTRLKDETLQSYFAGLFPRDNPKNTRFSINFFTSIGLGGLTDELRQHLKSVSKVTQVNLVEESESSSSSSSSGSSSDEESSSSESSSSDEDQKKSRNKPQEKSRPDKTRDNRKSSVSDDKHKKRSKSNEERKESKNKFRGNLESDKHQYKKDHGTGQGRHEDKLKQTKGKKDTSSSSRDEKHRPKISNQDDSHRKHRRDRDRS